MGADGDLLQEDQGHTVPPRSAAARNLCSRGRPLLTHASAGDIQTLKELSLSLLWRLSLGSGAHEVLFAPLRASLGGYGRFDLNRIAPLLPSCWGFLPSPMCNFLVGSGILLVGQQLIIYFGFFAGERPFYSTI